MNEADQTGKQCWVFTTIAVKVIFSTGVTDNVWILGH